MATVAELLDPAGRRGEEGRSGPAGRPSRLVEAVEALQGCVLACTTCADECLQEPDPAGLRRCIRLCLDCADVCSAGLAVLARTSATDPSLIQAILQTCVAFTQVCAEECARDSDGSGVCGRCAEACLRCEEACLRLLEHMDEAAQA